MISCWPLCTASPPLLARWVQWFGSQDTPCPTATMSTVVGQGRDTIYTSVMSLNFSSSLHDQ